MDNENYKIKKSGENSFEKAFNEKSFNYAMLLITLVIILLMIGFVIVEERIKIVKTQCKNNYTEYLEKNICPCKRAKPYFNENEIILIFNNTMENQTNKTS